MASEVRWLPTVNSAEAVADLLDTVAQAHNLLHQELASLATSRACASEVVIARLEHVLGKLRPASRARAQLGSLDSALLMAGVRVWCARHDQSGANRGGRP